jgi:cysteine desulfurase
MMSDAKSPMVAICLDHNASTPIDPAMMVAMLSCLDEAFGNPSSDHWASALLAVGLGRPA